MSYPHTETSNVTSSPATHAPEFAVQCDVTPLYETNVLTCVIVAHVVPAVVTLTFFVTDLLNPSAFVTLRVSVYGPTVVKVGVKVFAFELIAETPVVGVTDHE